MFARKILNDTWHVISNYVEGFQPPTLHAKCGRAFLSTQLITSKDYPTGKRFCKRCRKLARGLI